VHGDLGRLFSAEVMPREKKGVDPDVRWRRATEGGSGWETWPVAMRRERGVWVAIREAGAEGAGGGLRPMERGRGSGWCGPLWVVALGRSEKNSNFSIFPKIFKRV
jgi:hypothetical protein